MKPVFISIVFLLMITISKGQTTAIQFKGLDCNGNSVDLFADLDAGKAVLLHFYMPNCNSCPPPAQKIQAMANRINAMHPGSVKGYAFPYQNSTACSYSSTWVSSNNLSPLYVPMDSGAAQVAYYGGMGMPTVVLLGGKDHKVLFSTLSFSSSDTVFMRQQILESIGSPAAIKDLPASVTSFIIFPNPASDKITVTIALKETSNILLDIADIAGKQVAVIMSEKQTGLVTTQFNTATLPNGTYQVRLLVNGKTTTQKLSILN